MSHTTTSQLVRRLVSEVWNAGNLAALGDIVAAHYDARPLNFGNPYAGPQSLEQYAAHVREMRQAFPDLVMTVEDAIDAPDDRAYVLTRLRGTHGGPFFGLPATGRTVEFVIAGTFASRNGRLTGHLTLVDMMGALMQLGALPPPLRSTDPQPR